MQTKYSKRIFGGLILGLSLLGIGVMSSTTAQAQYRRDDYYQQDRYRRDQDRNRRNDRWNRNQRSGRFNDGYPDLGGSFDLRQTALNAGFTDGVKAGGKDLRSRRGYNYQDEKDYQKATRDYNSGRGDRYLYQQYYRMAFEHGYADGYAGYN